MRTILARYADAMDAISVFVGQGCSVLFFACIAVSAFEVVMRYGFDAPTSWSTELAMTLCAAAWVASVGYVTQRHRHISITMLELAVGERMWRRFRLVQMLVALVAVATLMAALWGPAAKALARMETSGTALNSIQPVIFKVLIVAGCGLYIAQLLANLVRFAQGTERGVDGGH